MFEDEMEECDEWDTIPAVGSLYKIGAGRILGVRSVDEEKREATCQEFLPSKFTECKYEESTYDQHGFLRLTFNELPLKSFMKGWTYDFDPSIKHEFSIKKEGKKKKIRIRKGKLTTLELFAGAGGMSQGLRRAKFDTNWLVEKDEHAAATLRTNLPKECVVYQECVHSFLERSKTENESYPKKNEVNHIHASPPCQGLSGANRNPGPQHEPMNELSLSVIDYAHHFEPKTITYENVPGLTDTKHRKLLSEIIGNLLFLKYQIRLCVLNANEYGDAQIRKRIIIFASKEDMRLPWKPQRTHGTNPLITPRTVQDAIGFLINHEAHTYKNKGSIFDNGIMIRDHCAPVSENQNGPDEDREEYTKLSLQKPAPTILCANYLIHPSKKRLLSVRECASLQSFPVDWTFCGPEVQKYKQIGNAVPVSMATNIARSVAQTYGMP